MLPAPPLLYPRWDGGNLAVKQVCEGRGPAAGNLSARQRAACEPLRRSHFRAHLLPLKPAFADHHWGHSWVGGEAFDARDKVRRCSHSPFQHH